MCKRTNDNIWTKKIRSNIRRRIYETNRKQKIGGKKLMWAIVKKEVKSYFLSPIGYVFIGLFLAMCSVFFYLDIVQYGSLQFENMFYQHQQY